MSITTLTWKLDATGDGSTTTYTCAFPVMRVVDVKVYVDDVLQTMNRDYTITGIVVNSRNHVDAGFQVVFTEAPASGADILIRRKTPRHNSNKLYKGDKFQLPVFENNYDNIVMMLQELAGIEVTGFQTPIVNDEIYPTWYPIRSGFFSGKIVDITQAPKYKVQASVPTQGRLFTYQLPIIENEAAEVNGRSDFSQGDDVLILPIEDSAGDTAWRFVGNAACNGGTPPYAGSYYNVTRCSYHTVNQIAYVRADEFSPGDVFIRNGVCYRVEATTDTPEDLSVVLRTSDVTMSTDCATCLLAVDPDTPDPPFQPTSYLRMARCEDDSMGEYSTPKEIMGIPVAEDLTKVYQLDGVCYYVTNNESPTPEDPLFPMHQADVFNDCDSCEASDDPCLDCDPTGAGNDPNGMVVTGLTGGCLGENNTFPYLGTGSGGYTETAEYCEWRWDYTDDFIVYDDIYLRVAKANHTTVWGAGCNQSLTTGEWAVFTKVSDGINTSWWSEKTTGFSCAGGSITGGHTYTGGPCGGSGLCPGQNPTLTLS